MRKRRRRALVAAAIAAAAALALTASAATARPATGPTTNVSAYAAPYRLLPYNPVLHTGESVQIVVTGFAGRATVTMQLSRTSYLRYIRADGHGVVHTTYLVPPGRSGGQYLITFQGQPPVLRGARPVAAPRAVPSADPQPIIVTVPRIGLFPYRLAGGPGPGGAGVGGISIHPPAADPGSGLAFTGADVVGAVLLALLALLVGAIALRAGRRRRR